MVKKLENKPRGPDRGNLSRRELLTGAAVAVLAVGVPTVMAAPARKQGRASSRPPASNAPLRRHMAAAAVLGDGRVLVAGGYDRPLTDGPAPSPLNSAMIYDPSSGGWSAAAPMAVPRARHAAVSLRDGRVAMLGGIGLTPTASVEIYDPQSNTWQPGTSLAQPRFDHTAASDGKFIYVLGGSSQAMLSSVEVLVVANTTEPAPRL